MSLGHGPRVAFVSVWDAANPNAESGYAFSMRQQLAKNFELFDVFPLAMRRIPRFFALKVASKLRGRYYNDMREPEVLKELARTIETRLAETKPDLVFAPSSIPLTYVESDVPTVVATDQVFANLLGLYVHNASARFQALGSAQEARALNQATRVSLPTRWAAETAEAAYGIERGKIEVIPWGANLTRPPSEDEVAQAIERRPKDRCNIVFIGRDWQRKGGDVVIAAVEALRRAGLPTHLTIIGCKPALRDGTDITVHPMLDKRIPEQDALFRAALLDAHFLFLPSRAEAYGQAFCEAAAYGVPSIGSTSGGIPTIVKHGETGFVLSPDAPPGEFAELILDTFQSPERYRTMALAARQDYRARLNWDSFGMRLTELVRGLLGTR